MLVANLLYTFPCRKRSSHCKCQNSLYSTASACACLVTQVSRKARTLEHKALACRPIAGAPCHLMIHAANNKTNCLPAGCMSSFVPALSPCC